MRMQVTLKNNFILGYFSIGLISEIKADTDWEDDFYEHYRVNRIQVSVVSFPSKYFPQNVKKKNPDFCEKYPVY